ncbi:MAG TPA: hypothetical protein VL652_20795 [Kutzneria sp.]|nr:hypothetical protein [Kutzneria sp.]
MELSFMDAYTLWRRLPYPPKPSGSELEPAFFALAEADMHAEAVIAFVRTGVFRLSAGDVVAEAAAIVAQVEALDEESLGDDLAVARELHAYAMLLGVLYQRFLEVGTAG